MTHIFIFCFPLDFIFFVVPWYSIRLPQFQVASIIKKEGRKYVPASPRRHPLCSHWPELGHMIYTQGKLGKSVSGLLCLQHGGQAFLGGGAGMDKDWLEKATNHDVTSLKFHVEAFFSGYAKIWKSRKPNCFCKDSQGKTILDGARDQDQRWYHLMMSYFRAGLQIRNEDLKQSCSEWEDTTLTIFRRPQRLAAKFRPEAEVGFLELADPWTFGECSLCREQCIEHCGGGGIWRYQMCILTSRKI